MNVPKVYWEPDPDSDLEDLTPEKLQSLYAEQKYLGLGIICESRAGDNDPLLVLRKKPQETTDANTLLQMIGEYCDEGSVGQQVETSRQFKLFALELAETLGPDHCQTLYRLAVLATKLA